MNKQKPNGGQNQEYDEIVTSLVVVGAIVLFFIVVWLRFHTQLATMYLYWRLPMEYPFFLFFQEKPTSLFRYTVGATFDICRPILESNRVNFLYECTVDTSNVKWKELVKTSYFWNILFGAWAVILSFLGMIRVQKDHPDAKFKKTHTLDSFIQEQKINQSHLLVFGDLNLQDYDNSSGAFKGMDTTREFAEKNDLIVGYTERRIRFNVNGVTHSEKDPNESISVINTKKLEDVLRSQIGRLWTGIDDLSDAEVILLAMYLPRACSTLSEMSDEDFNKIWNLCKELDDDFWHIAANDIANGEQFNDENILNINKTFDAFPIDYLKKYFIEPYINLDVSKELLKRHAYTKTFIISVVYKARTLGVMSPCQLRWLRLYDRGIWALLQNIGRPSVFCEAMGPISHFTVESILGAAVVEPNLDIAIKGYEYQVQSYSFNDEHHDFRSDQIILENTIKNDAKNLKKTSLVKANE